MSNHSNGSMLGGGAMVEKTNLYIICTLYSLVAFVTIIGNSLVFIAFFKSSKVRHSNTNFFIISLACADLISGCVAVPLYTYYLTIGFKGYNTTFGWFVYQFTDVFSVTATVWHLAFISLERYFAIVWPVIHHVATTNTYFITIVVLWVISVTSGGMSLEFYEHGLQYTIYNAATMFGLPLIVIIFSYSNILHTTLRRTYVTSRRTFDRELKVAFTIFILIALFVICWCPFFVAALYSAVCRCLDVKVVLYCKVLHFATSSVNPIVYAFRVPDFRNTFHKIFSKKLLSFAFCLLQKNRDSPPNSRTRASSTLSSTMTMVDCSKEQRRRPTLLENKAAVEKLVVDEPAVASSATSNKSVTFLTTERSIDKGITQ